MSKLRLTSTIFATVLSLGFAVVPGLLAPASAANCPSVVSGTVVNAPGVDWSGCELTGVDLTNANLAGANLDRAGLSHANLTGANLVGANLHAGLSHANLTGANLAGANLNAYLVGADLTNANVTGADMTNATLMHVRSSGIVGSPAALPKGFILGHGALIGSEVDVAGADLSNLDLSGLSIDHANLSNTNLSGVTLTNANMWATHLEGANLTGANLTGANLSDTLLTGANLTNANLKNAQLYKATLSNATLTGATMPHLSYVTSGGIVGVPAVWQDPRYQIRGGYLVGPSVWLVGADLSNLDLSNLVIDESSFKGANLSGTNLAGANLDRVYSGGITGVPSALPNGYQVIGGYLIGPKVRLDSQMFPGLNLSGLNLSGVNLTSANMERANLSGSNLSGANLSGANLTWANLTGALLTGTNLSGAVWSDTTCVDGTSSNRHNRASCTQPLDTTPPTSALAPLSTFSHGVRVELPWTGSDGTGSGIDVFVIRYNRTPVGGGTTSAWSVGDLTFPGGFDAITGAPVNEWVETAPGYRYCFQSRARDYNNNFGAWSATRCTNTPIDDHALAASSGWLRQKQTTSFAGTQTTTTKLGATLTTAKATTRQVGIITATCKTCGKVAVYVGATKVGTFSLYSPTTAPTKKTLLLPRFSKSKTGVIKLVTIKNPASMGKYVRIDGLLTNPV